LEWNSTCFGQFLCPPSSVFHCTHSNGICHTGLPTACKQDQDVTAVPSWYCSQAVSKPVWHIPLLCVQWKTPDGGRRKCLKHVEFHSRNKFEKLVHLVCFIIRNFIYKLGGRCSGVTPPDKSAYRFLWELTAVHYRLQMTLNSPSEHAATLTLNTAYSHFPC
jgi:hypothetical protein